MLRSILGLAAASLLAFAGPPAAAQGPQKVAADARKPYEHRHSHLVMPTTMLGVPRTAVQQIGTELLDVFASYETPGTTEAITVYVYRQVSGAVPVWFDRARWAIENRNAVYGTPVPIDGAIPFVPPGQSSASGLAVAYGLNQGRYRSTGLALLPLGTQWLVKVRYTSSTLSAAELAPRLKQVLAALTWPNRIGESPEAAEVRDCEKPLAVKGNAEPAKQDGAAALLGAFMLDAGKKPKDGAAAPLVTWCRDATRLGTGAVYRADGEDNGYLIALSDAGRGIRVQPDVGAALLRKPGGWSVQLIDMARTINFPPQDRLPPPAQALEILQQGRYVSAMSTWGDKKTVEINSDTLK